MKAADKKKRPKEDTGGESFNQPNNHSKLTDSNNCILFVFLISIVIAFLYHSPPPRVFFRSLCHYAPVCVPRHVTHVLDISARGLFIKDFRSGNLPSKRPKYCLAGQLLRLFSVKEAMQLEFLNLLNDYIQ
jgi:hypothetical protein